LVFLECSNERGSGVIGGKVMKRKVEKRLKALKHTKRVAKRKAHRKPIALKHIAKERAILDAWKQK